MKFFQKFQKLQPAQVIAGYICFYNAIITFFNINILRIVNAPPEALHLYLVENVLLFTLPNLLAVYLILKGKKWGWYIALLYGAVSWFFLFLTRRMTGQLALNLLDSLIVGTLFFGFSRYTQR